MKITILKEMAFFAAQSLPEASKRNAFITQDNRFFKLAAIHM